MPHSLAFSSHTISRICVNDIAKLNTIVAGNISTGCYGVRLQVTKLKRQFLQLKYCFHS